MGPLGACVYTENTENCTVGSVMLSKELGDGKQVCAWYNVFLSIKSIY
jgi:hypothetical protein